MPRGVTAEAAPRVPAATRGPISGSTMSTTLSMLVPSRGDPCLRHRRVSVRGSGKWRRRHTARRRAVSIPWPTSGPRSVHRRCQTPPSPPPASVRDRGDGRWEV